MFDPFSINGKLVISSVACRFHRRKEFTVTSIQAIDMSKVDTFCNLCWNFAKLQTIIKMLTKQIASP